MAYCLLLLTLVIAGCTSTSRGMREEAAAWQARLSQWRGADALLLGEQHDAPEHQQWQLDTVRWLVARRQLAALVLEMAESGNTTSGLPPGASEHSVRAALHWNDAAWPWQTYGPVVMAAVAAAVPVYGGNLPRPRMSSVMQDATLDTRLPLDAWQRQRQAMQEGHCHLLPETQITPMARIQLARDASMAQTVLQAHHPGRTVLLIAGSAHVLRSQGVPAWLPPEWSVKVAIAHTGPAATAMGKEANHLHSTPALPARDHCAELKARIKAGH